MHSGEPDPIFPAPRRPRKGPRKLTRSSRHAPKGRFCVIWVRTPLQMHPWSMRPWIWHRVWLPLQTLVGSTSATSDAEPGVSWQQLLFATDSGLHAVGVLAATRGGPVDCFGPTRPRRGSMTPLLIGYVRCSIPERAPEGVQDLICDAVADALAQLTGRRPPVAAHTPTPALRKSHFPDPPPCTLPRQLPLAQTLHRRVPTAGASTAKDDSDTSYRAPQRMTEILRLTVSRLREMANDRKMKCSVARA